MRKSRLKKRSSAETAAKMYDLLAKVRNDLEVHSEVTVDTATEVFRFFKETEE